MSMYMLIANKINGETWIQLPKTGTLDVDYAPSYPDQSYAYLWKNDGKGGTKIDIDKGDHTYQVGAGDALVYKVMNYTNMVGLYWEYK